METKVAIIVAVDQNFLIGANQTLPWHIPEDLKRFKRITSGHCVIMGRRTWIGIGKPLKDRDNIVVSSSLGDDIEGVTVVRTISEGINRAKSGQIAFIMGGYQIYKEGLEIADTLVLTEIHHCFDGDLHMPKIDFDNWKEVEREPHTYQDLKFDFVTYKRVAE